MMNGVAINPYKKTCIMTADPLELVILSYDGAIRALESAKQYLLDKRYEEKEGALVKAQNIIGELLACLNMEAGEIAERLAGLYHYMIRRIVLADIHKNVSALDEVIGSLVELKGAWEKIRTEAAQQFMERPRMIVGGRA